MKWSEGEEKWGYRERRERARERESSILSVKHRDLALHSPRWLWPSYNICRTWWATIYGSKDLFRLSSSASSSSIMSVEDQHKWLFSKENQKMKNTSVKRMQAKYVQQSEEERCKLNSTPLCQVAVYGVCSSSPCPSCWPPGSYQLTPARPRRGLKCCPLAGHFVAAFWFFFRHISIPCTWACSYSLDCKTSFDFYRVDCVSTSSEAFLYCKIHYSLFIYYLFIYYLLNNNGIIAWHQDKLWIEVLLVHVGQKAFCLIKILYLYRLLAIYHSILI